MTLLGTLLVGRDKRGVGRPTEYGATKEGVSKFLQWASKTSSCNE
jgi:hypothetical protein